MEATTPTTTTTMPPIIANASTNGTSNHCELNVSNNGCTSANRGSFIKSLSAPVTPMENEIVARTVGRRVSFPVDELLVTGYVEPPNPWENAVDVTTREVLAAYVEHCQHYDVNPLAKVIQQLQKIENFEKRVDCLDLQGENLESGQIEALEEIFKRIQFVAINLTNTSLDDEGSTALFDMMEYYESVERLDISRNKNISMRGWQACCRMIKRTHCLVELIAAGIIFDNSIHILQRTLRACNNLHTLHLENCSISGKQFAVLMAGLKVNTSLRELYLGENKLSYSDGVQIGNFLRVNSRLKLLNIANNQLEDKGVIHVTEGLSDQASGCTRGGLSNLVLANNRFTEKATPHLACVLMDSNCLESLDLGENDINNEGIHCLKVALINNRTLLHLGLKDCRITCQGAVALAEYIADNSTIQTMDLSGNSIQVGGLMALTHSMKVNQSVTKLELDDCRSKGPTTEDLGEQQLLSELSEYCDRNYEFLEKRREEEKERCPQEEELSEPISRLLSLWTDPPISRRLPPTSVSLAPPITISSVAESPSDLLDSNGWQAVRGMSHLRSPQPSPLSSPIPSPTRNRFRVTRVFQDATSTSPSNGSPPCPIATTTNGSRLNRFKFTVTPVKSINGVDAALPPPPTSTRDKSDCDTSSEDSFRLQESPTLPSLIHAQDLDESSDNDSVFLDHPVAEENHRHRHDSMTIYKKKREKEIRRSNSLPEVLGVTTVKLYKDRCIVLDSGVALDELYSRAFEKEQVEATPGESAHSENSRFTITRVENAHDNFNTSAKKPFVVQAVSSPLEETQTLPSPSAEADINGNIQSPTVEVARTDDCVCPKDPPTCDANANSSLLEESTEDGNDRDDVSSSGDRDSGIYLLDTSGDDLETPHSDGECPSSLSRETSGDVTDALESDCSDCKLSPTCAASEIIDRFLMDSMAEDDKQTDLAGGREKIPVGEVEEESVARESGVSFNLVDVEDGFSECAQSEYSRSWVLQTVNEAASCICKSASSNSLDLLTGDDVPWAHGQEKDVPTMCVEVCGDGDLMSFCEKTSSEEPETKEIKSDSCGGPLKQVQEGISPAVQRLDEDCGHHSDLVSIWVNGHESRGHEWIEVDATPPQKNTNSLTRRVALEGSESSSSSDSGVPESPISCSPPPVDLSKGPSFPAKKKYCLAAKSNGVGIGLQILDRLDLKSGVQLSPAQITPNKGLMDVAAEFLIPREGPSERSEKRRESTSGCPGGESVARVVHCGLPEKTLTAT